MGFAEQVRRGDRDKVLNLKALYRELRETAGDGCFDQSIALFDLKFLMFDILQAVGLCTLKNLQVVIGNKDAEAIWSDLNLI